MVCPFLKFVPAVSDWFITLPLPFAATFKPLFSNKYTASFNPIPTTLGVTEPDDEDELSGAFKEEKLFFLFFCRFLQVFPWGAKNQNISQVFLKVAFFPSKKSRLSLKRDFPKKKKKKCTYVFGEAQGRKKT